LYADTANTAAFKESEIYKDMAVKAPTVKSKLVSSIMRWFRVNVLTKMSTKIAEKHATKIHEPEASVVCFGHEQDHDRKRFDCTQA